MIHELMNKAFPLTESFKDRWADRQTDRQIDVVPMYPLPNKCRKFWGKAIFFKVGKKIMESLKLG
jgi:hypothetical protein